MGANFADSRGGVVFEASSTREAAYQGPQLLLDSFWSDRGNRYFVFRYQQLNTALASLPSPTPWTRCSRIARSTQRGPATGLPNPGAGLPTGYRNFGSIGIFEGWRFNDDGSIFNPGGFGGGVGNNLNKFTSHGGVIDGLEYAYQNVYDGTLDPDGWVGGPGNCLVASACPLGAINGQVMQIMKWYNPDAYTSSPQTRHSAYAAGTFDFTDHITAFARSTFATSTTKTRLFPANASFGWEATIPYNPATDSPLNPALNYTTWRWSGRCREPDEPLYANLNFRPTDRRGTGRPASVSVEMSALLGSRICFGLPIRPATAASPDLPEGELRRSRHGEYECGGSSKAVWV
jgi:hypothetical protein